MSAKLKYSEISQWIIDQALGELNLSSLFKRLCSRITGHTGISRAHLTMRALHPLVASTTLTWSRQMQNVEMLPQPHGSDRLDAWQNSPLRAMLETQEDEVRYRLTIDGEWRRFPLLREFQAAGGTEYIAFKLPFGEPQSAVEHGDGMLTSWLTREPGGFTATQIDFLRDLQPLLGVAAKMAKREETTDNIVTTYLGQDAGHRVLQGQIQRGDLETIEAVIWYSDMRGSTTMAEQLTNQEFLETLNTYFECTADSILEQGGEVLRFIGDAVLAIFPINSTTPKPIAAEKAWSTASTARERLHRINKERLHAGMQPLDFGLALHVGELGYGNIGVPTRLEFSVIGPVANEVARLEGLTKETGETVIVSKTYAEALPLPWRSLGQFTLRGVAEPVAVFALAA